MATKCTFNKTGTKHELQYYRQCLDCFPNNNEGACINCSVLCHEGHNLGPILSGPFYCDCGEKKCVNIKNLKPQDSKDNSLIMSTKSNDTTSSKSNEVASKLFKVLEEGKIFSPVSISYALALIHFGALEKTDQELYQLFEGKYSIQELTQLLSLFNNNQVKMTNALIVNQELQINKEFLDFVKNVGLVSLENFNDKVVLADKINKYIAENTRGLITNVISPDVITDTSLAFLINTIYFKSNWSNKFDLRKTFKSPFNSNSVQVEMMQQVNDFPYYEDKDLQMIEMPYEDDHFCMGVVLPKDPLDLYKIDISQLNNYIPQMNNLEVRVYFPKFTHRKKYELVPHLCRVGVKELFDPELANLSNISLRTTDKNTYISGILHEAVVIVDEEGTEAAAVTVAHMRNCITSISMPKPPKIFKADHSFIYYIRHMASNTLLFIGDFNGLSK